MNFFNQFTVLCIASVFWGLYFQDSASIALIELHNNFILCLVIILLGVAWIMVSIIRYKYLNHGTLIELIWTITPALILILIALPSFKLL